MAACNREPHFFLHQIFFPRAPPSNQVVAGIRTWRTVALTDPASAAHCLFVFSPKRLFFVGALSIVPAAGLHAEVTVKELPDRVRVEIDGRLFTEYRYTGAPHVYFYPLIGPGGAKMTRAFPMEDVPGEEHDHPHHRSLWYAHGDVNGVDFWGESSRQGAARNSFGKITQEKLLEAKGGAEGVIKAQLKWEMPDGTVPLRSVQTFKVYDGPADARLVDFEVTLIAGDKEVVFGDTKEGTMALRIAEGSLDVYPRFGPTSEWDTAAAQCVLEAAGGAVIAPDGRAFRYNQRPTLLNGDFLALGDPELPWKSWL